MTEELILVELACPVCSLIEPSHGGSTCTNCGWQSVWFTDPPSKVVTDRLAARLEKLKKEFTNRSAIRQQNTNRKLNRTNLSAKKAAADVKLASLKSQTDRVDASIDSLTRQNKELGEQVAALEKKKEELTTELDLYEGLTVSEITPFADLACTYDRDRNCVLLEVKKIHQQPRNLDLDFTFGVAFYKESLSSIADAESVIATELKTTKRIVEGEKYKLRLKQALLPTYRSEVINTKVIHLTPNSKVQFNLQNYE